MSAKILFPTQIWHSRLGSPKIVHRLNRELAHDIRTIFDMDRAGHKWSSKNYPGGYTSYASLTTLHQRYAPFMELRRLIDRHVQKYIATLEVDLLGGRPEMTTCWVNVMPPLSHHSLHLHPLSFISGTYYVDTPKGCGQIKFEDPRLGLFMAAPPRKLGAPASMAPFYAITPKAGEVVLFESWLRHEVTANQARTPRVSVSFNYEWVQTEAGC